MFEWRKKRDDLSEHPDRTREGGRTATAVVSPPEPMPGTEPVPEPGPVPDPEPETEPAPRGDERDDRSAYLSDEGPTSDEEDEGTGVLPGHRDPVDSDHGARAERAREAARERFGGLNPGAAFFGWLVALSSTLLVSGVVGAVVAGVEQNGGLSLSSSDVGQLGAAAGVFLLVAAVGWFAGGYVAGRMSRFDGGRQGVGVWLVGVVAMLATGSVGAIFGAQYDVLDRVDLPQLPLTDSEAGVGALVVAGAFLLVTLLAALLGGKAGHRYHRKVDRAHLV